VKAGPAIMSPHDDLLGDAAESIDSSTDDDQENTDSNISIADNDENLIL
jgi:hypothetical protein